MKSATDKKTTPTRQLGNKRMARPSKKRCGAYVSLDKTCTVKASFRLEMINRNSQDNSGPSEGILRMPQWDENPIDTAIDRMMEYGDMTHLASIANSAHLKRGFTKLIYQAQEANLIYRATRIGTNYRKALHLFCSATKVVGVSVIAKALERYICFLRSELSQDGGQFVSPDDNYNYLKVLTALLAHLRYKLVAQHSSVSGDLQWHSPTSKWVIVDTNGATLWNGTSMPSISLERL